MNRETIIKRYANFPDRDVWVNEAMFGYEHVKPYLDALQDGDRVLEVGSGSGILLSIISAEYPRLEIEGVESIGDGFGTFAQYHQELHTHEVVFHLCGYENLNSAQDYKLIFLINVLEHLPDWRRFIHFVKQKISRDGVCLILCPNYGFPYESHFGIPFVFSEALTYKIFRRKIARHEIENDFDGLWKSFNFVKYSQVKKLCAQLGLRLRFDTSIIENMIARLHHDREFVRRQKAISFLAKLVRKMGLLNLLRLNFIKNVAPYMKLEIKK